MNYYQDLSVLHICDHLVTTRLELTAMFPGDQRGRDSPGEQEDSDVSHPGRVGLGARREISQLKFKFLGQNNSYCQM